MRNKIIPVVIVLLPIILINGIVRVANQEVKGLTFSVVDNDRSSMSRRLIQKIEASEYFKLVSVNADYKGAMQKIESGESDFIVEITSGFEKNLIAEDKADIFVSANAVNGVKGGLGQSYLLHIINDFSAEILDESGRFAEKNAPELKTKSRFLYNPHLDYKLYMIPGIIALMLVLIVGFLPALNIVMEKEKGTIEQMNVTPVGKFEFIFSKLIPYWIAGLFIVTLSMILAKGIYGYFPESGVGMIYFFVTIFIVVISCFGLIISNYSENAQQAGFLMLFFLVIFILTSGLLTPIASMPPFIRTLTYVNPLRYFIEIMRALYLKGCGFADLLPQFGALAVFAVVLWIWAIRSYKKRA